MLFKIMRIKGWVDAKEASKTFIETHQSSSKDNTLNINILILLRLH